MTEDQAPERKSTPESAGVSSEDERLAMRRRMEEEEDARRAELLASTRGRTNMVLAGAVIVAVLAIAYALSPHK